MERSRKTPVPTYHAFNHPYCIKAERKGEMKGRLSLITHSEKILIAVKLFNLIESILYLPVGLLVVSATIVGEKSVVGTSHRSVRM